MHILYSAALLQRLARLVSPSGAAITAAAFCCSSVKAVPSCSPGQGRAHTRTFFQAAACLQSLTSANSASPQPASTLMHYRHAPLSLSLSLSIDSSPPEWQPDRRCRAPAVQRNRLQCYALLSRSETTKPAIEERAKRASRKSSEREQSALRAFLLACLLLLASVWASACSIVWLLFFGCVPQVFIFGLWFWAVAWPPPPPPSSSSSSSSSCLWSVTLGSVNQAAAVSGWLRRTQRLVFRKSDGARPEFPKKGLRERQREREYRAARNFLCFFFGGPALPSSNVSCCSDDEMKRQKQPR